MRERLRASILNVHYPYRNAIEAQRAMGLLWVTWLILGLWMVWTVTAALPTVLRDTRAFGSIALPLIATPIACGLIYVTVQRGQLNTAASFFVGVLFAAIITPVLTQFDRANPPLATPILLLMPVMAAGIFLDRRGLLWAIVLTLVLIGLRTYIQDQSANRLTVVPTQVSDVDLAAILAAVALASFGLYFVNGNAERTLEQTQAESERLQAAATYIRRIRDTRNEAEALTQTIDLVREQMRYASAQVFLMDESGALTRRVRSGLGRQESGASILLREGDAAIIQEAARTRQPVIIRQDDERHAHLIPPARASVTLPVLFGDQVLGALDVQTQAVDFSGDELAALDLVAEQLGIYLGQSRAIETLSRSLREQEETAERFQRQLFELRQGNERARTAAWTRYLAGRSHGPFGFDLRSESAEPLPATGVLPPLEDAMRRGEVGVESDENGQVLHIPILFRGETLGAMSFTIPSERTIGEREIALAQTVANRLALALENTRLYEQSQAQAFRERKASDVASLLLGATDVESVLNLAAQSFNEALGAISTRVSLQPELLNESALPSRGGSAS